VTARGDLAADEKATIELFEESRASVVYITTAQLVRDVWTRNVFSIPRGTGSGFIWDDAGHVVTNFHVIQGASEATVKLADGRDYQAALVGASPAHDIAVLKIGVGFKRPPAVPVGTSADLKVGQKGLCHWQSLRARSDAHHRHRLRA
jgi:S1-C subfamily serine protease